MNIIVSFDHPLDINAIPDGLQRGDKAVIRSDKGYYVATWQFPGYFGARWALGWRQAFADWEDSEAPDYYPTPFAALIAHDLVSRHPKNGSWVFRGVLKRV